MLTGTAKCDLSIFGLSMIFVPKGTVLKLEPFRAWPDAPESKYFLKIVEGTYKGAIVERSDFDDLKEVKNVGS